MYFVQKPGSGMDIKRERYDPSNSSAGIFKIQKTIYSKSNSVTDYNGTANLEIDLL